MEKNSIQVSFDKSHIITIGEKLYGESLELIREIVCNSYDADATRVLIEVETDRIRIRDDGSGMDEGGLREFFNIGSQNKQRNNKSPRYGRIRIGQFGIGKFAVLTACECFRIYTQKDGFSAEVIFDKQHWFESETWQIPLEYKSFDPIKGNGTTIVLEKLKKMFSLPEIERFVRERIPLSTPHFQILLNGNPIEAQYIPGRRFPVQEWTPFGPISGELILPNFSPKSKEKAGIECLVKGIVVCQESFGFDQAILHKLRGRISADFVPITSDRNRFITDSPQYEAMCKTMGKVLTKIAQQLKTLLEEKETKKSDETLKDSLVRMKKAIRRNPDISPSMTSPTRSFDPEGIPQETSKQIEEASSQDDEWEMAYQMQMGNIAEPSQESSESSKSPEEDLPRKVKIKDAFGKIITARKMKIGGVGITCTIEPCGKDAPAGFTESGIIYINQDHPLFESQKKAGKDMLGFYLSYLISQQVSLMLSEGDCRRAFEMQNRLMTDSWA